MNESTDPREDERTGAVAASQVQGAQDVVVDDATKTWTPPTSEASVVEDPAPALEDPAPALGDPAPAVEDPAPAVEEPASVAELAPADAPAPGAASRPEPVLATGAPLDKSPTFPVATPVAESPSSGDGAGAALKSTTDERPEILVGAAFAGGLVVAMILKRLG